MMKFDISSLRSEREVESKTDPKELFRLLPKKDSKYTYLREIQGQVLGQWYSARENKNHVIKMNTGSGKTVVGLLILKSSLNESYAPSVYLVPDKLLVSQVLSEAQALGIEATNDYDSMRFKTGKAVLVTTIQKLFTGKSVFKRDHQKIGSLIVDDVHACLERIESQFTMQFDEYTKQYRELSTLFMDSLRRQSTLAIGIEHRYDADIVLQVPYWSWRNNLSSVSKILTEEAGNKEVLFKFPLISRNLELCDCIISTDRVEIRPKGIPVDEITSFVNADRRIFMSATLLDDSPLISHLDVSESNIGQLIIPDEAGDIGDRMIIAPQYIQSEIDREEYDKLFLSYSKKYNVVVIVPSEKASKKWEKYTDNIFIREEIYPGIEKVKSNESGLYVIVNRYDGIDLPNDACRILVIDGIPEIKSEYEKLEEDVLQDASNTVYKRVQRIEQGMGRGIRSKADHCVVFLMGKQLVTTVYGPNMGKFSPATRAQLKLSSAILDRIDRENSSTVFEGIKDAVDYCLVRNTDWLEINNEHLVNIKYKKEPKISQDAIAYRKAYNCAIHNNPQKAVAVMESHADTYSGDDIKKGWLLQDVASYKNLFDAMSSQETLKKASRLNPRVMKPLAGIDYKKAIFADNSQGENLIRNVEKLGLDQNQFIVKMEGILNDLVFAKGTYKSFERAFKDLATFLGFVGQRPETEYDEGPDVLWAIGNGKHLIIEAKNEAVAESIAKRYCNQLLGSMQWFNTRYNGLDYKGIPVMIHRSEIVERDCNPHEEMVVINIEKLEALKENVRNFSGNFVQKGYFKNKDEIDGLFRTHGISGDAFTKNFTTPFRKTM